MTLVDTEVAALAHGLHVRKVRRMVERGQLANHGTARRMRVDLWDVAFAAPRCIEEDTAAA